FSEGQLAEMKQEKPVLLAQRGKLKKGAGTASSPREETPSTKSGDEAVPAPIAAIPEPIPPAQATPGLGLEASREVGRLFRFDSSRTPPRLPGTRSEAQGIAAVLGGDTSLVLLGPEATERRVWDLSNSGELAQYRYVHFATHGWVDTERPELSGLVLSLA